MNVLYADGGGEERRRTGGGSTSESLERDGRAASTIHATTTTTTTRRALEQDVAGVRIGKTEGMTYFGVKTEQSVVDAAVIQHLLRATSTDLVTEDPPVQPWLGGRISDLGNQSEKTSVRNDLSVTSRPNGYSSFHYKKYVSK